MRALETVYLAIAPDGHPNGWWDIAPRPGPRLAVLACQREVGGGAFVGPVTVGD
jgi:hypothetical protein